MSRMSSLNLSLTMRVLGCAILLGMGGMRVQAQNPAAPSTPPAAQKPADANKDADKDKDKEDDENDNPFAPEPAPTLPPGMKGSDANDPRAKLTPGVYDAGETSMGMKHLALIKKPDAFQLGTSDPEAAKVKKVMEQLGINDPKIPKEMNLVIAQLAFANSDMAFQGTHLFQGKFLWNEYFRHFESGEYEVADVDGLPRRTGRRIGLQKFDVHVGRDAEWTAGLRRRGISRRCLRRLMPTKIKIRTRKEDEKFPLAQKERFRGVRIFDISDIKNPKQVAAVQTCRGSHTHTLVLDPNDKDNVTSMSRALRLCGSRKSWRDALAKSRTKIRTRRCFALK